MTVARPLGAFATAVFTGSVVNFVVRRGWDGDAETSPAVPDNAAHDDGHDHGHDHSAVYTPGGVGGRSVRDVTRDSVSYAFGPLLDDLTSWLIIGLLVSGLIAILVPEDFFRLRHPGRVRIVGADAAHRHAHVHLRPPRRRRWRATLIAKGLDPGAALVLLLVGPATNATTIAIIARLLGRRVLVLHLLGVTGSALLLGLLINFVYTYFAVDLTAIVAQVVESGLSPLNVAATVLFVYLLVYSTVRMRLGPYMVERLRAYCAPLGFDPLSPAFRVAALVVVVALYVSTAFSVIGPGEAAWVVRFGRVVRTLDAPGLYAHYPLPVDRVTPAAHRRRTQRRPWLSTRRQPRRHRHHRQRGPDRRRPGDERRGKISSASFTPFTSALASPTPIATGWPIPPPWWAALPNGRYARRWRGARPRRSW